MTRSTSRRMVAGWSLAALLPLPVLGACTNNASPDATTRGGGDARSVSVSASDTACTVSTTSAPAGSLTFRVTNQGNQVTEFYLLAADGQRIVGEVENVGPGLSRDLVLSATPGNYRTACKPRMVGNGIQALFVVTGSSGAATTASADDQRLLDAATSRYAGYIQSQSKQLVSYTERFRRAYLAGRDDQARTLYPLARTYWERVEPVAESFGDLDPKMDLRVADVEAGMPWTGWHRLEKDLWPARATGYRPLDRAGRQKYAGDLLANTEEFSSRTRTTRFTAAQMANGAKGLLDEVASKKVTGEEEYWSRTDLWDFQANVDGARAAYDDLRPVLKKRNPALDGQIDAKFLALQKLLDAQKKGSTYRFYDQLSQSQIKNLSDAVNALSEPLSQLTAAVI